MQKLPSKKFSSNKINIQLKPHRKNFSNKFGQKQPWTRFAGSSFLLKILSSLPNQLQKAKLTS